MVRLFLTVGVFLVSIGCGKNDVGIRGNNPGNQFGPIAQAPMPQQPYYPPQQQPYTPTTFAPQMPPNMPPQFYPWLPMNNFFIQQPQLNYVWVNIWTQWQAYANQTGCGVYNFPVFWNQYFPVNWNYGPYLSLYQYFRTTFYPWMNPGVVLPPISNPIYFWGNYSGMSFGGFNDDGMYW